jgi:CheY-like chemotaxis protein
MNPPRTRAPSSLSSRRRRHGGVPRLALEGRSHLVERREDHLRAIQPIAGASLDLLRHLSATGSRIPAVILTAHGDDEARQQSLESGAVAFLSKPFNGKVLLDAVRTALDERGRRPG